jgi:AAA domain
MSAVAGTDPMATTEPDFDAWEEDVERRAAQNKATRQSRDNPPPINGPEDYGYNGRSPDTDAHQIIDLATAVTFLGDARTTPPRELIKKHLPAEGVAMTGGQSSAGKTFIQIHKAICLAAGLPYFGHLIAERVGTAFVAAEGRPLLPNRFDAAQKEMDVSERLPIVWFNHLPDFTSAGGVKLFIRQLKELNTRFNGDFGVRLGQIVIDTVAASFGMKDEDDNAEASKVCKIMRLVGDEVGALMAPVHNYGKNPESGLRGASAWRGSADVVEGVLADIDPLTGRGSNRELVCSKARDGEQGPISLFDLKVVQLGFYDDGDPYGS